MLKAFFISLTLHLMALTVFVLQIPTLQIDAKPSFGFLGSILSKHDFDFDVKKNNYREAPIKDVPTSVLKANAQYYTKDVELQKKSAKKSKQKLQYKSSFAEFADLQKEAPSKGIDLPLKPINYEPFRMYD